MAKTTVVYDKNGTPVTINGVRSEYKAFFRLIHNSTVELISEPIGWGEAEKVFERDEDYHGFHYEYISANTPLTFLCEHSRHLIEDVYSSEGGDGNIYLQYGIAELNGVIVVVEYEGRLDLNTYDYSEDGITCQIERKSLHEVVKSRWDTIVDLFGTVSLDETTITAAAVKQISLHSMKIRERYEKLFPPVNTTFKPDKLTSVQLPPRQGLYYILPNMSSPSVNEIKTANDTQMLWVSTDIFDVDGKPLAYAFEFISGGEFQLDLSWTLEFDMVISRKYLRGSTVIGDLQYTGKVAKVPTVGLVTTYDMSGSTTVTINDRETGFKTFTGTISQSITVEAGDKLLIYLQIGIETNVSHLRFVEFSSIETKNFSLKLEGATLTAASATKGLTYGECVLQALRVVTGLNDPLRAPVLGIQNATTRVPGEAANYFVASGFMIRKFDEVNKPLKTSLSELITSGNALFALGLQYDENNDGQFVKIQAAKDFYSDNEIIYIESCSDYKEVADKAMFYNQIEIGYEKYIDDPLAIGNLDEYNTRHEYQTPIRTEKNKWSKLSKLVGSGYAIEQTRREQFLSKPNDSTQFDDNNFIISLVSVSGGTLTATMSFNGLGTNNYIAMGGSTVVPNWVVVGMAIQVSGTAGNNRVFTVTLVDVVNRRIWVKEDVNTSLLFLSATIASYNYLGRAEKDEAFDLVDNLFGADTAYNLRRTPRRMLITHSPFILSGLKYKADTEKIKSTFVKNNGLLTTQLNPSESYPLGDINYTQWTENEDMQLSDLQDGVRIFSPEKITFSCRLSKAEINLIRRALLGKTSTTADYGYISVKNNKGVKVSGYPLQIVYKENSEECKFVLRKKS